MPVKFGVLGVGQAGSDHVEAIRKSDRAVLAAVAEPVDERANKVNQGKEVRTFEDYEELMDENPPLDAIINCLPHHMHYRSSLEAVENGYHILLEKPMCIAVDNADEIIRKCEEKDLKLAVGYVHRYRSEMLEAKNIIDRGVIGEPAMIMDNLSSQGGDHVPSWVWEKDLAGGGVLMYGGVHALDRILWFLEESPSKIYGQTMTYSQETDCEDGLMSVLEFESGVRASLFENSPGFPTTSKWETEVFGSQGKMRINYGEKIEVSTDGDHYTRNYERYDHFKRQLEDFIDAIEEDSSPWITGEDGRESLKLANAIYESADTGEKLDYS